MRTLSASAVTLALLLSHPLTLHAQEVEEAPHAVMDTKEPAQESAPETPETAPDTDQSQESADTAPAEQVGETQAADDETPPKEDAAQAEQEPGTNLPVPSRFGEAPIDEAFGAFQRGLYITAHNLALPRAEAGDAAAQTLLAEIYSRGLGRAQDAAQARFWYEKAAAQGVPEAEFRYGVILLQEAEAEDDSEKRAQARIFMEKAAERGNGLAAFNMAQLLLSEQAGNRGRVAAFDYFMKAAERNVPDAQYAVARYYVEGVAPVMQDHATAVRWLRRAAVQNFDTAQFELGQMLLSGVGVERDLEQGFGWVLRAANGGSIVARAELAKLYWGGIGTEPDVERAGAWYVLTRRAGYRDRVLEDFWAGLSEERKRKAIELANDLL